MPGLSNATVVVVVVARGVVCGFQLDSQERIPYYTGSLAGRVTEFMVGTGTRSMHGFSGR